MREMQLLTKGRAWWPIDWAYLKACLWQTIILSDDSKIRWLMALSSLIAAGQLWATPTIVDKPFFIVMRSMAPAWVWATVFFLHGIGGVWRILERKERVAWARIVNGLGLAVWMAFVTSQLVVNPRFALATSIEAVSCIFLFISFVSTGPASKTTTA